MIRMLASISIRHDGSHNALYSPSEFCQLNQIFSELSSVHGMYPRFREWFFEKGTISSRTQQRAVFVKKLGTRIVGVAIAKRCASERKLCTLWVSKDVRSLGIASTLADSAFDWLQTSYPLFTIPEERLPEFQGLLRSWRFSSGQALKGYYRSNKIEYVFNGALTPQLNS
jgi:hypothetical protein